MAKILLWSVNRPMYEPDDEFVRRLKERIESDPDLTPSGLALKAGLDNSAIRSLLVGRAKSPRFSTVIKIMDALGTTLEEFMGDPRTPAERDILDLVSRMPADQRMQLLGFAKALSARPDPAPTEDPEEKK